MSLVKLKFSIKLINENLYGRYTSVTFLALTIKYKFVYIAVDTIDGEGICYMVFYQTLTTSILLIQKTSIQRYLHDYGI